MTSEIILEKRIVLEARCLDSNFLKHLKDKLLKVSLNSCSKETGHIMNVKEITKIVENYISNVNSEIVFIVQFKADVLKPSVGLILEDRISMVFAGGVFLNILNKFQVLIPSHALKGYTFSSGEKKSFVNTETKASIKEGDICQIKITGVRFKKNNFDCFGELLIET